MSDSAAPTSPPLVVSGIALIVVGITIYMTVSTISFLSAGGEANVRIIGFPITLALVSAIAVMIAVVRWNLYRRRER